MTDLLDILVETLAEADPVKDVRKSQELDNIVNQVKELIAQKKVEFGELKNTAVVKLNGLTIKFLSLGGSGGAFFHDKKPPYIEIYGSTINPSDIKFNEDTLRHELTHFLDFSKSKSAFVSGKDKEKEKNQQKNQQSFTGIDKKYLNKPTEMNAFFFEVFLPSMIKYLKGREEIPASYDEFKRGILQSGKAEAFYNNLEDKNRRKLDKRLGTFYTNVLKNKNFNLEKPDNTIDDKRTEKATTGFWQRIKDRIFT